MLSATDRSRRVFGGASFGGIAALHMLQKAPEVFSGILSESPSLWAGEGGYLGFLRQHPAGQWPERVFLGCGTREYSGTRDHERLDIDAQLLDYAKEAAHIIGGEKGVDLRFVVDEGAGAFLSKGLLRVAVSSPFFCSRGDGIIKSLALQPFAAAAAMQEAHGLNTDAGRQQRRSLALRRRRLTRHRPMQRTVLALSQGITRGRGRGGCLERCSSCWDTWSERRWKPGGIIVSMHGSHSRRLGGPPCRDSSTTRTIINNDFEGGVRR